MVERVRRSDGNKFYGCPNFPKCTETAPHEDTEDDLNDDWHHNS